MNTKHILHRLNETEPRPGTPADTALLCVQNAVLWMAGWSNNRSKKEPDFVGRIYLWSCPLWSPCFSSPSGLVAMLQHLLANGNERLTEMLHGKKREATLKSGYKVTCAGERGSLFSTGVSRRLR